MFDVNTYLASKRHHLSFKYDFSFEYRPIWLIFVTISAVNPNNVIQSAINVAHFNSGWYLNVFGVFNITETRLTRARNRKNDLGPFLKKWNDH